MARLERLHAGFMSLSAAAMMLALAASPSFAQSKAPAKGAAPAAAGGDAALKARVESLEEQLVDMQVVIGTLESLSKNGGAAAPFPAAAAGSSADAARIDGLETQIRALTSELQNLSDQVRSLGGSPKRSEIPLPSEKATADASGGFDSTDLTGGFGSTTVSQGHDAIGGLLEGHGDSNGTVAQVGPPPRDGLVPAASQVATAALPPASDGINDPKQLYETAYGYLLQRDYGAAETSFTEFLSKFPNDSLSGNAQYWLGETHFVRGQYKSAAGAFLKGYQTYGQSGKAPDSLLKLAMSLDRLGQKEAACSSFSELSSKFPTAPQSIKTRAQSERQRIGCQ
ncbi:tol-pal system protein YbgF [Hyphomicrobium methylovorum]|uniref:tol-pal system protein YbgF n=1 Tax=Hyphomicrobium methylovorum TaxID=84 RepID=UPI0015E64512|nr:tol-pal system protein YbgF [Hyphomicrobium methylovorum]MBA2127070.1 tol-pal system protein YbgF [Hyphomicrobium methylovorum]